MAAGANRAPPHSEITVIDAARAVVADRMLLDYVAHGFHVAFSADGRLGVAANCIRRTWCRLRTWSMAAHSPTRMTLFGADVGKPVEVPLDELERYAARPFGVAISPDKSRMYVSCGGSEMVTVIDVSALARYSFARMMARLRRICRRARTMWLRALLWGMIRAEWR